MVAAVDEIFRVAGTPTHPATAIRIVNLTLTQTAPTYMKPSLVPSGGDYAVRKTAAIHLNGTADCEISGNLLDRVGGNAIAPSDFNRHASIVDNEIAHPGENGILLVGSTDWVDGRGGNQPRRCTIARNVIHHVGLYTKQSCAIFHSLSCQNTIADNVLFAGTGLAGTPPSSGASSSPQCRRLETTARSTHGTVSPA